MQRGAPQRNTTADYDVEDMDDIEDENEESESEQSSSSSQERPPKPCHQEQEKRVNRR